MTDAAMEMKVTAASISRSTASSNWTSPIHEFARSERRLLCQRVPQDPRRHQRSTQHLQHLGGGLGPFWSASRAIWGMFWTFLILERSSPGCRSDGAPGAIPARIWPNAPSASSQRANELLERAAAATERQISTGSTSLAENIQKAADSS